MSKRYRFTATHIFSCEAIDEKDAWEQFCMSIPYKASHFNDIEWEEEEIEKDE